VVAVVAMVVANLPRSALAKAALARAAMAMMPAKAAMVAVVGSGTRI